MDDELFERYIKLSDPMPTPEQIETDPGAIWTARLLWAEMNETLDAITRPRRRRDVC